MSVMAKEVCDAVTGDCNVYVFDKPYRIWAVAGSFVVKVIVAEVCAIADIIGVERVSEEVLKLRSEERVMFPERSWATIR